MDALFQSINSDCYRFSRLSERSNLFYYLLSCAAEQALRHMRKNGKGPIKAENAFKSQEMEVWR